MAITKWCLLTYLCSINPPVNSSTPFQKDIIKCDLEIWKLPFVTREASFCKDDLGSQRRNNSWDIYPACGTLIRITSHRYTLGIFSRFKKQFPEITTYLRFSPSKRISIGRKTARERRFRMSTIIKLLCEKKKVSRFCIGW